MTHAMALELYESDQSLVCAREAMQIGLTEKRKDETPSLAGRCDN